MLIVCETPMGSNGQPNWLGVRRYNLAGSLGPAVRGNGIDKTLVSDPSGLFRTANDEFFVGNRHGNQNASSVSRFLYDFATDSFVANGTVTGNSLFGTHGVAVSQTGELLGANVNGPVSRFTPSGINFVPNGTMGSGAMRDVFVSPNGQWVYTTCANSQLVKYAYPSGTFVNSFTIGGASSMHWGAWRGNELFIADFGSGNVFRVQFDGSGNVSASNPVATMASAIGVAFSPDQQTMFVSGHTSNQIGRFSNNAGIWTPAGTIATDVNLGDIEVFVVGTQYSPTSITFGLGRNGNGGTALSLTAAGDGDELQTCKGFVPNVNSPYLRLTVTRPDTGLTSMSACRIDLRARTETAGSFKLTLNAKLNGGSGATRDSLVVNPLPNAYQDKSLSLTAGSGSLNDYLGTLGQLGCQVEVQQVGFAATAVPCSRFDKLVWTVLP